MGLMLCNRLSRLGELRLSRATQVSVSKRYKVLKEALALERLGRLLWS